MKTEATIEQRLARLDQSNKRLKTAVIALGILVGAGAILGASAPTPKAITAERFTLVDDAGTPRAELSASTKATALQLLNADGTRGIVLAAGSATNAIYLSDKKGNVRVGLNASDDGTATFSMTRLNSPNDVLLITDSARGTVLALRDGNGKDRLNIGYTDKGASMVVADANETVRAIFAEQGVVTFKKGGQIDWASAGENLTPEERNRVMDLINHQLQP